MWVAFASRLYLASFGPLAAWFLWEQRLGWVAAALALIAAWRYARRWPGPLTAHGTARFASRADMRAVMASPGAGLHIGRLVSSPPSRIAAFAAIFTARWTPAASVRVMDDLRDRGPRGPVQPLWLSRFTHCAVFGPSGSGKSAGLIIPTLLAHRGPVIVLDVKGELYGQTAAARRKMGRNAFVLDPFRLVRGDGGDGFNPLFTGIDPDDVQLPDLARDLATALVARNPNEHQPFFNDMAVIGLTAFILFAMRDPNPDVRTLESVADVMADPVVFAKCLAVMGSTPTHGPVLRRLSRQLASLQDKERASVLGTIATHLAWLNSDLVARSVRTSTVDPLWLRDKRRAADLWLVLPPERLASTRGLTRFWLAGIIRRLMAGGVDNKTEVLVLLDEIAAAGHLEILETAVNLLRGWNVKLVFVYQSPAQLQECFPGEKARNFLANTSQVFFKPNDYQTAKDISERCGQHTVLATSAQGGGSASYPGGSMGREQQAQRSTSWSVSRSEHGRPLLRPEEVLAAPPRSVFVFTPHAPPIAAEAVFWFEPGFRRQTRRRRWVRRAALWCLAAGAAWVALKARPAARPFPAAKPAPSAAPTGRQAMGKYGPVGGKRYGQDR